MYGFIQLLSENKLYVVAWKYIFATYASNTKDSL